MIFREKSVASLRKTMDEYADWTVGFYPEKWLSDDRNIALTDGKGNYGLAQFNDKGTYYIHSFMKARGKEAKEILLEMIDVIFNVYGATALLGLTPRDRRNSRIMNRWLGLKSYGEIETADGPQELFILTKKEYEEK